MRGFVMACQVNGHCLLVCRWEGVAAVLSRGATKCIGGYRRAVFIRLIESNAEISKKIILRRIYVSQRTNTMLNSDMMCHAGKECYRTVPVPPYSTKWWFQKTQHGTATQEICSFHDQFVYQCLYHYQYSCCIEKQCNPISIIFGKTLYLRV